MRPSLRHNAVAGLADGVGYESTGIKRFGARFSCFAKATGRIANKSYQEKFGVTKATASRHLEALADKGILIKIGTTGKGTYYVLSRKGLTNGPKDS